MNPDKYFFGDSENKIPCPFFAGPINLQKQTLHPLTKESKVVSFNFVTSSVDFFK